MSKRKPAMQSKHARKPKIITKAQRAAQAIVRSPKNTVPESTETLPNRQEDPKQEHVENPALVFDNPKLETPGTASQDHSSQIAENKSEIRTDFSLTGANMRPYQVKLLEIAQADMHFALQLAGRFLRIRSPVEFSSVITEFTIKRVAMFQRHLAEMAELITKR
jgi:hypothetical protein